MFNTKFKKYRPYPVSLHAVSVAWHTWHPGPSHIMDPIYLFLYPQVISIYSVQPS